MPLHVFLCDGGHRAAELKPRLASMEVTVGGKTSRTFTLTVRLPGRGTVPLVLSGKNIVVTPDAAHAL